MADKININSQHTTIFVPERDEITSRSLCDQAMGKLEKLGYTKIHIKYVAAAQHNENKNSDRLKKNNECSSAEKKKRGKKLFKNIIKCYNCIFRFVNQNLLLAIRLRGGRGKKAKRAIHIEQRYAKYPRLPI